MLKRINSQMKESMALRITVIFLSVAALGVLFVLGIFRNFGFLLAKSTPFPIDMHSALQANYQTDPEYMEIPPMDIQLVVDAIWDQNLNAQNLSLRLTQVNDSFIASVASVTPKPTITDTPESGLYPTTTPGNPIPTIDLTQSPTPTEIRTNTAQPPTNTTSPPTETLLPPTVTVSPCSQLSIGSFNTSAKKATWRLINNSSAAVSLDRISLSWPVANGNLGQILFNLSPAWEGSSAPPSIVINPNSLSLAGNSTKKLDFIFFDQAVASGYSLSIKLSGCTLNETN